MMPTLVEYTIKNPKLGRSANCEHLLNSPSGHRWAVTFYRTGHIRSETTRQKFTTRAKADAAMRAFCWPSPS